MKLLADYQKSRFLIFLLQVVASVSEGLFSQIKFEYLRLLYLFLRILTF